MSRLLFEDLEGLCIAHGFHFEREKSAIGNYVLFSNEHAPGVEGSYKTLDEAWIDIGQLEVGANPLTGEPLGGFIEEPEEIATEEIKLTDYTDEPC